MIQSQEAGHVQVFQEETDFSNLLVILLERHLFRTQSASVFIVKVRSSPAAARKQYHQKEIEHSITVHPVRPIFCFIQRDRCRLTTSHRCALNDRDSELFGMLSESSSARLDR